MPRDEQLRRLRDRVRGLEESLANALGLLRVAYPHLPKQLRARVGSVIHRGARRLTGRRRPPWLQRALLGLSNGKVPFDDEWIR